MIGTVPQSGEPYRGEEDKTPTGAQEQDEILADMRDFMQSAINYEAANRWEALDDLRFLTGRHWPDDMQRQRMIEQRPALTINKLPTFLHQVTNEQRLNRPSIKVHPVDSNADVETAKVVQGIIKYIEYNSNADVAEDRAVNSAAACGIGYLRLLTDFESDDSFDQEIRFGSIPNPMTVYFDPESQEPDGSDAKRVCISKDVNRKEFERQYPKANAASTAASFPKGAGDNGIVWIGQDTIRLVEFYRVETTPAKLCMYADGTVAFKDASTPAKGIVIRERDTVRRRVMWRKCTAVDILEETEIPCRWIPVFPVYGDEVNVDGRVYRSGIVRWAKDPSRQYDYFMSAATEEVALRPKAPYIGAVGQFENLEQKWEQANRRSFSYLEYNPVTVDGALAPPPQRQPMADIPVGMLQMAMHANDNIKATTGLFDSSLGARGHATSGIQERELQRQGNIANYHYTDNLNRTKRHVGRCIIDMIPKIYDAQRVVRMLGEDEEMDSVEINKPVPGEGSQGEAVVRVLNDMTIGKYDVTVASGPSYSTMREEAADAMIEFGKSWPKLMDVAGDKVVRAMDWPGAEEIAERIKRTMPPQLTQDEEDGPPPLPPAVVEQMQQADQLIQMGQQRIAELTQKVNEKNSEQELKAKDIDAALDRLEAFKRELDLDAHNKALELEVDRVKAEAANQKALDDIRLLISEHEQHLSQLIQPAPAAPNEEADQAAQREQQQAAAQQVVLQSHQELMTGVGAIVEALLQQTQRTKTMTVTAPSGAVYRGEIG